MHVQLNKIYYFFNLLLEDDLIFNYKCSYGFIDDFFILNIKYMGMLIKVSQEVFVVIALMEYKMSNFHGEDMVVKSLIRMLQCL
jgi:hypothetical protein